jgi:phage gp29-like protein
MSKKRKAIPRSLQFADATAVKPDPAIMTARVIKMDDLSSFIGYLPNPDEVLRASGEAISIFREMKTDSRIKSLLRVAKAAVLNYPIQLEQGQASDSTFALVKDALADFSFYGAAKRLLSGGMDYGFAAVEVVWKNDSLWRPIDAVARKPERFRFDSEGRLKYAKDGTLVDLFSQSYKWLVWRHDKDAENPYGTSALASCYWPWKFKKAGAEFWLMATEKFSVPSILALFDCADDEGKIRERAAGLAEMLGQVGSGSGAALANIRDAKVLSVDGKLSEFKTLMDWCDTQIAYGIVYQSLAVQEAQNGTRAQAEVHEDTFLQTMKDNARELAPVLQDVIDWVVELNVGPGEPSPRLVFDLSDYASWEAIIGAIDRGVPVSLSALYDRYALPKPTDTADSFVKPQGSLGTNPGFFADDDVKKKLPKARPPLRLV